MAVWGHFVPSLSPATSDCSRFVSGPSADDELMTVDGTEEMIDWTLQVVGFAGAMLTLLPPCTTGAVDPKRTPPPPLMCCGSAGG